MTKPPTLVIALSGQMGTGVSTVARGAAQRLDFRVFDEELLADIAARARTTPELADLYNRQPTGWMPTLVSALAWPVEVTATADELPVGGRVERGIVRETATAIRAIAARGHAVICGRGAAWILAHDPTVLRVHLVGNEDSRARRVFEGHDHVGGFDESSDNPLGLMRRVDASRAAYIRRFHDGNIDSTLAYDLSIDVIAIGWRATVSLIEQAVAAQCAAGSSEAGCS